MPDRRPLAIGLSLSPTWLRADSWRRADSRVEELFSVGFFVDAARAAEASAIDFLFKPDVLALDPESTRASAGFSSLDPTVLLSGVARETRRIGLVTTLSTTFVPPMLIARQIQSLHRVSDGRAGWNIVMSLDGQRAFGIDEMPSSAERYARAAEVVDVVRRLWDSYPAEALILDRETGRYADPARFAPVEVAGRHVAVTGVNTVPSHPAPVPIFQAGGSEAGLEFAAATADAVFAMTPTIDDAARLRADLADRATRFGRPRDAVRVLPGISLVLATDRAAARRLADSIDLSGAARGANHWSVVGTPHDAVRSIIEWSGADAIDGVIALPGGSWESLRLFTDVVVPALADEGLVRGSYASSSFAANLGISVA